VAALTVGALFLVVGPLVCLGQSRPGQPKPPARLRWFTIMTPNSGEFSVRVLPSPDGRGPALQPTLFTGRAVTLMLDPVVVGRSPRIAVDDTKSGTSAVVDMPKGKELTLQPVQFDRLRTVEVVVTRDGLPLRAASVSLEAENVERSQAIDATMAGTARFNDVPIGKATITVRYGDNFTEKRELDLRAPSGGGPLRVSVAATNDAATTPMPPSPGGAAGAVAPPAPATPVTPPATPPAPRVAEPRAGGGATPWVGEILGLIIAAGALYAIYRWAQSGQLAATLKKAGVQVEPQPAAADGSVPWIPAPAAPAPVVSDPALCPYCGQKKDASGACACTIAPSGPVPGGGVQAVAQPRLIGMAGVYAGAIFVLQSGATAIGREPANPIALPDDNTVSRRHATLRSDGGTFVLADEGSSNGVFVNGVRVAGTSVLSAGDEVQIGNTRFRFEV
jgi:hypothetical protein